MEATWLKSEKRIMYVILKSIERAQSDKTWFWLQLIEYRISWKYLRNVVYCKDFIMGEGHKYYLQDGKTIL